LPVALADGLSLGPSGFPFYNSDTGGYIHSPANQELFLRWTEANSVAAVMEVGDASSMTPWERLDQAGLDTYRTFARLHLRLFPLTWTLAQNLKNDGRPLLRALGLAYPDLGAHPSDTYLFGDDLLVAPVIEAGATQRKFIVPPGDWIDWFDGTVQSGGDKGGMEVTVPAPIDKLPLFVRAGGIVPLLRPTIDTTSPTTMPARVDSFATDPGLLHVRIAPGPANTFTVYDMAKIAAAPGMITLTPGNVFHQGFVIEVLRTAMPASVTVDGSAATQRAMQADFDAAKDGWLWESARNGSLWIKVAGGPHTIAFK
jgi:alpha-D-xyloside xylohydrolase